MQNVGSFQLSLQPLLDLLQSLDDDSGGSTASVANGCETILAGLQLVEKSSKDSRARTSKRVADGDSASDRVDTGILKTQDLWELDKVSHG